MVIDDTSACSLEMSIETHSIGPLSPECQADILSRSQTVSLYLHLLSQTCNRRSEMPWARVCGSITAGIVPAELDLGAHAVARILFDFHASGRNAT
jgi:hypothetical protein